MSEAAEESGLHEYIDAEIAIESLTTPTQEKALYTALDGLNGVHNVSIKEGKVSVKYEPVCVTEQEIVAAIQSAGFRVVAEESTLRSLQYFNAVKIKKSGKTHSRPTQIDVVNERSHGLVE